MTVAEVNDMMMPAAVRAYRRPDSEAGAGDDQERKVFEVFGFVVEEIHRKTAYAHAHATSEPSIAQ